MIETYSGSKPQDDRVILVQGRSFRTPDTDSPTRHLFVANCGVAAGLTKDRIVDLFSSLCATELQLSSDRRSIVFASFPSSKLAEEARQSLVSKDVQDQYRSFNVKFASLADNQVEQTSSLVRISLACFRIVAYNSEADVGRFLCRP